MRSVSRVGWSCGTADAAWNPLTMTAGARTKGAPHPHLFVSADSKGLNYSVSPLQSPLTRGLGRVAFKGLRSLHNPCASPMDSCRKLRAKLGYRDFGAENKKRQPGCRTPNGSISKDR